MFTASQHTCRSIAVRCLTKRRASLKEKSDINRSTTNFILKVGKAEPLYQSLSQNCTNPCKKCQKLQRCSLYNEIVSACHQIFFKLKKQHYTLHQHDSHTTSLKWIVVWQ